MSQYKKIDPKNIFYIKLGEKGVWNKECIEVENTVKVGFVEFTNEEIQKKDWENVKEYYRQRGTSSQWVSIYTNQLINFYESDESTLWITFYKQKLWWAFAHTEIYEDENRHKYRKVIGKWSSADLEGRELMIENLSGNLVKVQGFRSTICNVREREYIIKKINCEIIPEVIAVNKDFLNLQSTLGKLIKKLRPLDFEILIDLIFRQLGCRRISIIGGPQKTKDIELESPVTNERYLVQVKSSANLRNFREYEKKFEELTNYDRYYYVVHTPSKDLQEYEQSEDGLTTLWRTDDVTKFSINCGLIDWIINKVS